MGAIREDPGFSTTPVHPPAPGASPTSSTHRNPQNDREDTGAACEKGDILCPGIPDTIPPRRSSLLPDAKQKQESRNEDGHDEDGEAHPLPPRLAEKNVVDGVALWLSHNPVVQSERWSRSAESPAGPLPPSVAGSLFIIGKNCQTSNRQGPRNPTDTHPPWRKTAAPRIAAIRVPVSFYRDAQSHP